MQKRTLTILIASIALIFAASCSDDPADPVKTEDPISWPDMTNRDDVIKTIVLAYANPADGESMSRYNALLHTQYFFGLAAEDVRPGDTSILTRAEDIASTEFLFDPTTTTVLELTITPEEGSWYDGVEIDGEPCENCYGTERQYFIRAQFGDEMTIYQSPPGRAFAVFIIAPDESDASKWVLRAMYDLGI